MVNILATPCRESQHWQLLHVDTGLRNHDPLLVYEFIHHFDVDLDIIHQQRLAISAHL